MASNSNEISLTVDETNALRASLGLKPLNVSVDPTKAAPGQSTMLNDNLVAPVVPGDSERTLTLKEKLEARKQRREIETKLSKVRTLGEVEEVDDARAWVQRISVQKKQQQSSVSAYAERLRAMDEEAERAVYTSKHLAGLAVAHDESRFEQGQDTVLTLRDASVLDEDTGDVLENIDIVDQEKLEDNLERRKKKPTVALDDEDPLGLMASKPLLAKYDDVDNITGDQRRKKVEGFKLDQSGTADLRVKREQEIQAKLNAKPTESLTVDLAMAADFYTPEEMTSFKKRKKVRKVVKRKERSVKAEDLLALEGEDDGTAAALRGSRVDREKKKPSHRVAIDDHAAVIQAAVTGTTVETADNPAEPLQDEEDIDELEPRVKLAAAMDEDGEDVREAGIRALLDQEDDAGDLEDDSAQLELQAALERARRAKMKTEATEGAAARVAELVARRAERSTNGDAEASDMPEPPALVFSSMTEFVRTVGSEQQADKDEPRARPLRRHRASPEPGDGSKPMDTDEQTAGDGTEPPPAVSDGEEEGKADDDDDDVLPSEMPVSRGIAAALQVALTKGFVEVKKKERVVKERPLPPTARVDGGEDRARDERRMRDRGRDYDPFTLPGFTPNVMLKYQDDEGNDLDEPEAFRYLSHAFHGKGVGKNKAEKLLKRKEEANHILRATTDDTPLNTLSKQKRKMEELGSAHLVLDTKGMQLAKKQRTK